MKILVTGGTGYIGSHTCVELLNAGHEVIIVDNLCNSQASVAERIAEITGKPVSLIVGDILDSVLLDGIFTNNKIDAVMHFAALKSVPASMEDPLSYYRNNVVGTLTLCEAMKKHGCKKIVFSSSATVYGISSSEPITEDAPLSPKNPYGNTKLVMETVLSDLYASDNDWGVALLRYFNPIGAHESGLIGEVPGGIPGNLMPYITQVAAGILPRLKITGDDYDTPDGTGVRDYIHVTDLAIGHLKALEKISEGGFFGIYNLGAGRGYSVYEVIHGFEEATGITIPYIIAPRRAGDLAIYFADPSKANRELGWKAERNITEMCGSSWRFASQYYKKY